MERRKFMIGLGSAAAGSAALVGTGAFSAARVPDREATINVANNDKKGGIGLIPGNTDIAYMNEAGELEIDLQKGLSNGGTGMNPNSTYYLGGKMDETLDYYEVGVDPEDLDEEVFERPLFSVRNQSGEDRHVQFDIELKSAPDGASISAFAWQYSGIEQASVLSVENPGDTDSGGQVNLSPGHEFDVVIVVESGSDPGQIELEITITSGAIR
ncbi:hypothetical protein OB905_09225 [Halobacteria archaeon AArc-dxtr1]|nr:hypothetical protein [Halobacteria archaeon AArc-dxtr1]